MKKTIHEKSLRKHIRATARADIKKQIKTNKAVFFVYLILRTLAIGFLVFSLIQRDYENAFVCLLVLFLYMLPSLLKRKLYIELPTALEIVLICFIFAGEILGEVRSYYVQFPHWDLILHTTWGFICAAFGFALVDMLNRDKKIKLQLSPLYLALAAFCFSMTIGVLWEFFEFGVDNLFHKDMQKDTVIHSFSSVTLDETFSNIPIHISDIEDVAVNGQSLGLNGYLDIGLYDTMEDLFVNFIGALIFSIIGFINAKTKGKSHLAKQFIPIVLDAPPENGS